MARIKYIVVLIMATLLPFAVSALEPIFKLKNQSIMLASAPSTIGVVYDAEAFYSNDFSKKYISEIEFAGKNITVSNVNVIDWDKKSQALIVEFNYEGTNYCFYFPQNIKASHVTKKRPYTRFYVGRYNRYLTDTSYYVEPKDICISYWLASDIDFLNSKIGAKFRWDKESQAGNPYILTVFDPMANKYQCREFNEGEIKPSNSESRSILPRKTIERGDGVFDVNSSIEYLLKRLYWIE